ncbi:hypothetical protein ACFWCF_13840 [Rhodococcus sp. NPDC060090]|uniref:hypothetical protein n=1 Tax=Rhodococcus sp. NPDC060090 TaxID=3347056 RepID=UPI00365A84E5
MSSPSARLSDMLDAGALGLDFFAAYLPRAHQVGIAGRVTVEGLGSRYDEQNGLDVSVLADDAAVFTRLVADLASRIEEQTDGVRALRSAWRGDAGDLARDDLDRAVQRGAKVFDAVHALAGACTGAVDGITRAVAEKAYEIGQFAGGSVDGRTPEDIDVIIAGARDGDAAGPTVEQVASWCAESGTPSPGPGSVAAWCERWLHEVFGPTIQERIDRFIATCDIADDTVDDHLSAVARAFDLLDAPAPAPAPAPASEGARYLGGGSRDTAGITDGPTDVLRAATDLVDAGRELVGAVAELTGAVVDFATTAVEGATAVADAVTFGIVGPSVEGSVSPQILPPPILPPPTGLAAHAEPAPTPRPESLSSGALSSGILPSEPELLPPESSPSEGARPSGPVVAQVPAGVRVDRRTGANAGAATTDSDEAEPPTDDGDGVVLAEAGPL